MVGTVADSLDGVAAVGAMAAYSAAVIRSVRCGFGNGPRCLWLRLLTQVRRATALRSQVENGFGPVLIGCAR